jgi:Berberine and berberine like
MVDAEPPLVHHHVPPRRRAGRHRPRGGRVQRQARRFAININAVWAPPEPDDVAWTREQWDRIHGFSAGVYVNFLDDEPAQRTRAAYGTAAYGRLLEVKRRYDPDNVFRSNHNIDPAVRAGPARR